MVAKRIAWDNPAGGLGGATGPAAIQMYSRRMPTAAIPRLFSKAMAMPFPSGRPHHLCAILLQFDLPLLLGQAFIHHKVLMVAGKLGEFFV